MLGLEDLARLVVPGDHLVTHLIHRRVSRLHRVGVRPARCDDQVQLRLDPDVVHVVRRGERLHEVAVIVELDQRARRAAVLRAEHRDQHPTGHRVEGVRAGKPRARREVGHGLQELGVLRIRGDVVDEQPVRKEPTREDPVGVRRVAEVVRFVRGRPRGHCGDDLPVCGRGRIGVQHREKIRVLLIGVAGPDVQQGLVLIGPQASDEHRLVFWSPRAGHDRRREGGAEQQQ